MNPFQGATADFEKTVRKVIDAYGDLAEDLAERRLPHDRIIESLKTVITERETVRAHTALFDNHHHNQQENNETVTRSLKEAVKANVRFDKMNEFVAVVERVWVVEHPEERMPAIGKDGRLVVDDHDNVGFSVTAERETLSCPITLRLFEDPVRAECGHVFERSAIVQLATAQNFKCPIAGCHRVIKVGKLQSDAGVKRRVQQSQRKRLFS